MFFFPYPPAFSYYSCACLLCPNTVLSIFYAFTQNEGDPEGKTIPLKKGYIQMAYNLIYV